MFAITRAFVMLLISLFWLKPVLVKASEWPNINLVTVNKSRLPPPSQLKVAADAVYHSSKQYEGYPLGPILKALPLPARLPPEEVVIVFTAQDGYKVSMAYQDAFMEPALVAYRDLAAPAGKHWIPFKFGGNSMTPAPYYLVWRNAKLDKWRYPWPFQLVSISLQSSFSYFGAAAPSTDNPMVKNGFNLFSRYCIRCHAVNHAGGTVGPELIVPKSVVGAYSDKQLADFILDAPASNPNTKMPIYKDLINRLEVADIIRYFKHMTDKK